MFGLHMYFDNMPTADARSGQAEVVTYVRHPISYSLILVGFSSSSNS